MAARNLTGRAFFRRLGTPAFERWPLQNLPAFRQVPGGTPAAAAAPGATVASRQAGGTLNNITRGFAAQASGGAAGTGGGPVSFTSLGLMLVTGTGLYYGYKQIKDNKIQKATEQKTVSVGKANVGGPFSLINQDGKRFTDKDLLGEFAILYFGFCTCPDICPDELEKLAAAVDDAEAKTGCQIRPVFISVDPDRDTPRRIKSYIKEFHPRLIGLTGKQAEVDVAAKAYRVYYMKTDDTTDYLIDHSIIMYLVDPNGDFVTFFGKNFTQEQLGAKLASITEDWASTHPEYKRTGTKKAAAASAS